MDQGTEKWLLTFRWMLWLAPAGLRGGLKLEAYHQSRQPQSFFLCGPRCSGTSDRCSGRCGVIFLRAVAAAVSSSTSLRRLRLGVAAQASRTSLSDVSAIPDVAASRVTRRRATAISTLFWGSGCEINASHTQGSGCEINASHTQGCGCDINASHTQGSGCEINASLSIRRRQHVMARPRASRSSSYRASGGRGVGFDMACCNVLQQSGSFGGHPRG